jgi:hypothetical protein
MQDRRSEEGIDFPVLSWSEGNIRQMSCPAQKPALPVEA